MTYYNGILLEEMPNIMYILVRYEMVQIQK
jgi:hypothetical protein